MTGNLNREELKFFLMFSSKIKCKDAGNVKTDGYKRVFLWEKEDGLLLSNVVNPVFLKKRVRYDSANEN